MRGYFKHVHNEILLVYLYNLILEVGKMVKMRYVLGGGGVNINAMVGEQCGSILAGTFDFSTLALEDRILAQRIIMVVEDATNPLIPDIKTDIYIYRDAMASGLQNMVKVLGANEGVIEKLNLNTYETTDPYTHFIDRYKGEFMQTEGIGVLANFNRKTLKPTIMTMLYGAGSKKTLECFKGKIDKCLDETDKLVLYDHHKRFHFWMKNEKVFKLSQEGFTNEMTKGGGDISYETGDGYSVHMSYYKKRKVDDRIKIKIFKGRKTNVALDTISGIIQKDLIVILKKNLMERVSGLY